MNDKTSASIIKDSRDSTSFLILILLASQIVFQGVILWRLITMENKLSNSALIDLQANAGSIATSPDSAIVHEVSIGLNPPRGDIKAPLTIVEFSDFSCPYCKESAQLLKELIDSNPGKIRLYYRHLIVHDSFRAALAAECAGEQDRFWEMHDALFKSAPDFSENQLLNIAKSLNLEETDFSTCLSTEEFKDRVQGDIEDAQKLGATGTPTFFINGRMVIGSQSIDGWKSLLNLP